MDRTPLGHFNRQLPPLPRSAPQRLGLSALRLYREAGLTVPEQSRLPTSIRQLDQFDRLNVQFGPGDPATERLAFDCHRTVFEFAVIAGHFRHRLDELRPLLEIALAGPVETNGPSPDKARDRQAELLTGVFLDNSDNPVRFAEPDLLVALGQANGIPVAVKRLHSERNFVGRLRGARRQLRRAKMLGLVVVNAEVLTMRWYEDARDRDFGAMLYQKAHDWLDAISDDDPNRVVRGLLALSTLVALRRAEQSIECSLHGSVIFLKEEHEETSPFARLARDAFENVGRSVSEALAALDRSHEVPRD